MLPLPSDQNHNTMSAQDPFMTLVDAATALIDDKKQASAKDKAISVSVTKRGGGHASTTPPPRLTMDIRAALVTPSTPKTTNRMPTVASAFGYREPKQTFARVLMDVCMNENLSDIITFLPDGDAFAILEPKLFVEKVMPKYFNIKTFSPFVRKLHRWGFERIMDKKTHAVDVFRHPLFVRGNYVLCSKIRCTGRLVKGPFEEALLAQAGLSNKTIGMPMHQELDIRNFCERMHGMQDARTNRHQAEVQNEAATQVYFLEQATKKAVRRQQQEAQETLMKEAQFRQAEREMEARRKLLRQQMAAETLTVGQLLLASIQQRNREEELLAQELQRIKQEKALCQHIANEASLSQTLQQARLQELLAAQGIANRIPQSNDDISAALLRAILENNNHNSGASLAAQLRQFM
jgi:hypothetical protein